MLESSINTASRLQYPAAKKAEDPNKQKKAVSTMYTKRIESGSSLLASAISSTGSLSGQFSCSCATTYANWSPANQCPKVCYKHLQVCQAASWICWFGSPDHNVHSCLLIPVVETEKKAGTIRPFITITRLASLNLLENSRSRKAGTQGCQH